MNADSKILFVSMTNYMGGAESVLNMLAQVNNSPLIFLRKISKKCVPIKAAQNVKFITAWPLIFGFILLIKELYVFRRGYIIMASHPYVNAYLGILKRVGYIKSELIVRESTSIFIRYSGFKRLSYQVMYYLGYPAVNTVVCQTEEMKSQLLAHNRFLAAHKVLVRTNPIHLEEVQKKAGQPIDEKDKFICAAGRLLEIKGFHILIQAFSQIHSQYPGIKLFILGDGPQKPFLLDLIQKLRLQNQVILKGHISNPYPYFKKAELCVVPSILEGFPNVLLQMMALNRRVISTLCAGGIEDISIITKVPTNHVEELSKAICRTLGSDGIRYSEQKWHDFFSKRNPIQYLDFLIGSNKINFPL